MTAFSYAPSSRQIIASWRIGAPRRAEPVAGVPESCEEEGADLLVAALCGLSEAAWATYADIDESADPDETNTEQWHLREERADFDKARVLTIEPGERDRWPYSPLLSAAKRLGLVLDEIGDARLRIQIARAVDRELDAVVAADMGDFAGLAQQAVTLSRLSASPVQIQAAWAILERDLLGAHDVHEASVDPTAACVATTVWLRAAAIVATASDPGDPSPDRWTRAVARADDIEAMPIDTIAVVFRSLADGLSPRATVERLVRNAHRVAAGQMPGLDGLRDRLLGLDDLTEKVDQQTMSRILDEVRVCVLDPLRPAPSLLEALHTAIFGCFLLWRAEILVEDPVVDDCEDDQDLEEIEPDNDPRLREAFAAAVAAVAVRTDRMSL
ncbi:hypothetical protein D0Z08_04750 [Nocardioides immobilis]|uniref:Uncharacterized protein n=1 Tax=Nocardioides immobilis TaxID=2049295 RepID=A0A417Y6K3_9ACTN|nr:hypothetical protein [Nocardioides immobilis]RHW28289.1 hypothetical protein D0Z08_04750 [Nocardioides immobilis]